jgi:hypothetical protein
MEKVSWVNTTLLGSGSSGDKATAFGLALGLGSGWLKSGWCQIRENEISVWPPGSDLG